MKSIYFAGSIRGGRQDAGIYKQLIDELKNHGAVLTEHIGAKEVSFELSNRHIHDRNLKWLSNSDILVAEVTTPSLGVGYEIGRAVTLGKPVVCLYRKGGDAQLSAMIAGLADVQMFHYSNLEEAIEILRGVFSQDT